MKKTICLLLALILVLSVPTTVFAEENGPAASGTCGESATWTYADGTLTISGTGTIEHGFPNYPWKAYISQIEHIVVEEGFTEIPACCFVSHNNVKTITLPDSLVSIGTQAFPSCNSLTEITVPKNVEHIGFFSGEDQAAPVFSGDALVNIHVDPENRYFYSVDGVLFHRSTNTLLCYPMGRTASQYTIPAETRAIGYGAFWHSVMEQIILPNGLETIGDSAFFGADFTSMELPGSVRVIGNGAFENCDSLTSITIPESVQRMEQYAFSSCEALTEITILNPECGIALNANAIDENAVIRALLGSTAQTYAQRFGRNFVDTATGQLFSYNQGNAAYLSLLPLRTGGTAPSFNSISMSSSETGEVSGYQPNIILERDPSNPTYQEMLAFVNGLTGNCATDYEKARIISTWVHENMTYVFGHWGQGTTAEGVYDIWHKRVGNCEGYTQLTNFLLHLVGIPTATVTSYAHTWTAALIDEKWIMIDSTNDLFDESPDECDSILRICFAVNDNLVCFIDDLTGVKLASYGLSIADHAEETEITIPSYVTHIYSSTFFMEDIYGSAITHLTIHGTEDPMRKHISEQICPITMTIPTKVVCSPPKSARN